MQTLILGFVDKSLPIWLDLIVLGLTAVIGVRMMSIRSLAEARKSFESSQQSQQKVKIDVFETDQLCSDGRVSCSRS